jgi:acetyl esterase/lipase
LNDVITAYKSIIFYYKKICKIDLKQIVLIGDSAGGALIAGLINYLIVSEWNMTMPSLAIYFYPAVNLDDQRFTPSLLQAFEDKFLYFSLLEVCIESYIPQNCNPKTNFFISPYHTPEEILSKHPRSMFLIGEKDPLLDDGMKYALKLSQAGV